MHRREFLSKLTAIVPGATALASIGCSSLSVIPGMGGGGGMGGSDWVGRRYFTRQTRFWGYLKRPNDPWSKARLVIFNEKFKHAPDRLPELARSGGRSHGYDHNFEYRLKGSFTGNMIYDPNSDKTLPEFILRDYQLLNESPAPLFESYSAFKLPPRN